MPVSAFIITRPTPVVKKKFSAEVELTSAEGLLFPLFGRFFPIHAPDGGGEEGCVFFVVGDGDEGAAAEVAEDGGGGAKGAGDL